MGKNRNAADSRRETIVRAGLECFLKHGYSKTSVDDIAKASRLSRPLIYLKFKNKEEIFRAVFEYVLADGFVQAKKAASAHGTKAEKLMGLMEALLLGPWERVMGQPMSSEFYKECSLLDPEVTQRHEQAILKHASKILNDKELGEVFALATLGIQEGLPDLKTLRRRLEILIERFANDGCNLFSRFALQTILGHSNVKITDEYSHFSKSLFESTRNLVQYPHCLRQSPRNTLGEKNEQN